MASARRWPWRALPVTVLIIVGLIIVGLAGLRGGVTAPRWNGPLHTDPVAVGIALEVLLAIMLAIALRRLATRARAGTVRRVPAGAAAVKLRRGLVAVLSAAMIAIAVTIPVGLHQHLFTGQQAGTRPNQTAARAATSSRATGSPRRFHFHLFSFNLHLHLATYLLYGLVFLLFVGAVALRVRWVRRYGSSGRRIRAYQYLDRAPDPQDLLEVVESGQWALRAIDDARAAIIACYVAMEASLGEHGAARAIADTPDELLTRATDMGIVRGTAAGSLTGLFYEARFSSHPLDRGHRDAAGQALAELAAELAEAERASRGLARRTGARA